MRTRSGIKSEREEGDGELNYLTFLSVGTAERSNAFADATVIIRSRSVNAKLGEKSP